MLITAFFLQDIVWAYPSDGYKNLAVTGLQNKQTLQNMKTAMSELARSRETAQAKIKDPDALRALLKLRGEASLQNVYNAALYFIERDTPGAERLLKMAVTRKDHLQEEFLGEFVEARAVESNVKHSKIVELSVERFGQEVDFILEVNRPKYPFNTAGGYELEDGLYLGESKTAGKGDSLEMTIEKAVLDKVGKYKRLALKMRSSGENKPGALAIKGIIFAIGGEVVLSEGIRTFSITKLEKDESLREMGIEKFLALVPDTIVARGGDKLNFKERSFVREFIQYLKKWDMLDMAYMDSITSIVSAMIIRFGISITQARISEALKNAGASPYSRNGQSIGVWNTVFGMLGEQVGMVPATDFSKQKFIVNRERSVKGRTGLAINYWQAPLNELKDSRGRARCEFEIAGLGGKWVPLVDEYDQVVIAHVAGKESRDLLGDYFVFRLDPFSDNRLVDIELKKSGLESERLLYYAHSGAQPLPVRIPVAVSLKEELTPEMLIGFVKAAVGGSRLMYHYGKKPLSADMAKPAPIAGLDNASDGDTANPFILEHIDEGRTVEVYDKEGKVVRIRRDRSNPRAPPVESHFKANGTFEKIREAKDPALLKKILREKRNFRNLSPKEQEDLIRIIRDIRLSFILGRVLIGERPGDYMMNHVRTGFSGYIHNLEPTIWIGEILFNRITVGQLAQSLLEEAQHILKPPRRAGNRWINLHGNIDDAIREGNDPAHVIEHDRGLINSFDESPATEEELAAAAEASTVSSRILELDGREIIDSENERFILDVKKAGNIIYPIVISINRKSDLDCIGTVQLDLDDTLAGGEYILNLGFADIAIKEYQGRGIFPKILSLISKIMPPNSELHMSSLEETKTLKALAGGISWNGTRMGKIFYRCGWKVETIAIFNRIDSSTAILLDRANRWPEFYGPRNFMAILANAISDIDDTDQIDGATVTVQLSKIRRDPSFKSESPDIAKEKPESSEVEAQALIDEGCARILQGDYSGFFSLESALISGVTSHKQQHFIVELLLVHMHPTFSEETESGRNNKECAIEVMEELLSMRRLPNTIKTYKIIMDNIGPWISIFSARPYEIRYKEQIFTSLSNAMYRNERFRSFVIAYGRSSDASRRKFVKELTAFYRGQKNTKTIPSVMIGGPAERKDDIFSTASILGEALAGASRETMDNADNIAKGKALILYADDLLERGTAADFAYTLKKTSLLENSVIILYERKPGRAELLEKIINSSSQNKNIVVIKITPLDMRSFNGGADINVEFADEVKELDLLLRHIGSRYHINNGTLLGVVKGRTDDSYKEGIRALAKDRHVPVVSFEHVDSNDADKEIYSFVEALRLLISMSKDITPLQDRDWFRLLKPIEKKDIERAYQDYRRALEVAINA